MGPQFVDGFIHGGSIPAHGVGTKHPARSFLSIKAALYRGRCGLGVVFGQRSTTWEAGPRKRLPTPFPPIPPRNIWPGAYQGGDSQGHVRIGK